MATVFAIIRCHNLLTIVILMSIYGLLSASFFALMDAVDVAFTEAAVGIVVSTILLLSALTRVSQQEKPKRHKPLLALLTVSFTGALLIYGTLDMPSFGSADTPVHQHVAKHYIQQSLAETGVINVVSSVLASYRGFDTWGELIVIFTAGIGVLALLGLRKQDSASEPKHHDWTMNHHPILRVVSKMLIPLILLFALYVQFHGDYGPGGGFQAGAIFASGMILYALIFGTSATLTVINKDWLEFLCAFGVLLYGGVGLVAFITGHNFLDYYSLAVDPVQGQHIGILLVELGVGITVAAMLILIYLSFTRFISDKEVHE